MKMPLRSFTLALTFTAAALFGAATTTHAQTVISSLPYTIRASGYYVLGGSLNAPAGVTSGDLITISASNVTLDFQDYYIAGAVGGTTQTTIGVHATEQSNITIKNGTVAFCAQGVLLEGNGSTSTNAVGALVSNMRITYCYRFGINIKTSPASRITDCQVSQTGYNGGPSAVGIFSDGALVQNNVVSSVLSSTGYGIYIHGAGSVTGSAAARNFITNCPTAILADSGTKYQDNLTVSCPTTFTGGTDAGGNN